MVAGFALLWLALNPKPQTPKLQSLFKPRAATKDPKSQRLENTQGEGHARVPCLVGRPEPPHQGRHDL